MLPPNELLTQWETNWAGISDLAVAFDSTASGSARASSEGMLSHVVYELRWNGTQYYSRETRADGLVTETSFDPAANRGRFFVNSGPRGHAWIASRNQAYSRAADWLIQMLRPPVQGFDVGAWRASSSLSAMLESPASRVRPALVEVDGRVAAVLDVYGTEEYGLQNKLLHTVWLDVERNAVPLRCVRYDANDASVQSTTNYRDYTNVEGAWLPLTIETVRGAGVGYPGLRMIYQVRSSEAVAEIHVNQGLSPGDCTVQYPSGAYVIDEDAEQGYYVNASETSTSERMYLAGARHRPHLPGAMRAGNGISKWGIPAIGGLALGAALRRRKHAV